jgi:hypothetical protein
MFAWFVLRVHADKGWREESIGTIQGCKVGERKARRAVSNYAKEAAAHKNKSLLGLWVGPRRDEKQLATTK